MVHYNTGPGANGVRDEQGVCKTVIERSRDQPDRCTIYDTDAASEMSKTRWLSALEGSYVFSELMR